MAFEETILVVDDDAVSRHVLCQTLADAGLTNVACESGTEALTYLAEHVPQVVLLDLVMPAPDGYAILHHVRQTPRLAEVPVVVLTALESDDEIGRASCRERV